MIVWLDGCLCPVEEARIDPADRGFTLGDGLYETIRARDGKPLRLAAHFARLQSGAGALGIPLPYADRMLAAAMTTVLSVNALTDGVLRLTLTRGPAPRGLASPASAQPTLLISAAPPPAPLPPARVIVATCTRRNELSPTTRFKTLNMLDSILARREAEQRGADDALLLNGAGRLAEATAANLFLVIDGEVVTPPAADGALPGVMRGDVLDRLAAVAAPLTPGDFAVASEAFLTNANGIRAVVAVDGKAVGSGEIGPVTLRLKAAVD
jgi:branched-chain amino acid aminotransferase